MKIIISKEESDSLNKAKGEVRGIGLKVSSEFVLKEKGKQGLKLLEKTMADLGYPLQYEKVKATTLYPLKMDAVNFLAMSRLFEFDDEKLRKLGRSLVATPFALKIFARYFVSFKVLSRAVPKIWEKSYPIGKLSLIETNLKERHLTLRLENFDILPIYCRIFTGHFAKVLQMVIKKESFCEETKCTFKGDPCHEFRLRW